MDYRYFKSTDGPLDALVSYLFIQDSLVIGFYVFMEEHLNENDYIGDFEQIKGIIMAKYGKAEVSYDWKDKPYSDNPQDYGYQIKRGNLVISYTKETERTRIDHSLRYESLIHSDLINRARAKAINDIF